MDHKEAQMMALGARLIEKHLRASEQAWYKLRRAQSLLILETDLLRAAATRVTDEN